MSVISDFAIPVIILFALGFGLFRKADIFAEFTAGVKEGLGTVIDVFPALFALVVAVGMFRASGAVDMLTNLAAPVANLIGFPKEAVPLVLLRPFSGSGAVATYQQVLQSAGPDSFAGRVASVILGSSETTFYTIAVYFAATKVKKTRHALPAALLGDFTVMILGCAFVRILL